MSDHLPAPRADDTGLCSGCQQIVVMVGHEWLHATGLLRDLDPGRMERALRRLFTLQQMQELGWQNAKDMAASVTHEYDKEKAR